MFGYFKASSKLSNIDSKNDHDNNEMVVEVEENERFHPKYKSWKAEHLLQSDPKRFNTSAGQFDEFPEVPLADGWRYDGSWEVDVNVENCSLDGWVYGTSFLELDLGHSSKQNTKSVVRRKRWIRQVVVDDAAACNEEQIVASETHCAERTSSGDSAESGDKDAGSHGEPHDARLSENVTAELIEETEDADCGRADGDAVAGDAADAAGDGSGSSSSVRGDSGDSTACTFSKPSADRRAFLENYQVTNVSAIAAAGITVSESQRLRAVSNAPSLVSSSGGSSRSLSPVKDAVAPQPCAEEIGARLGVAAAEQNEPPPSGHDSESAASIADSGLEAGPEDSVEEQPHHHAEDGDDRSICAGSDGGLESASAGHQFKPVDTSHQAATAAAAAKTPPAEPTKKRTSWFSSSTRTVSVSSTPSTQSPPAAAMPQAASGSADLHADPALKVLDPALVVIGKQIRSLESDCRKADEEAARLWKRDARPQLETQIADLERLCAGLKARIEAEAHKGAAHLSTLEEELRVLVERQDELKRKMYFPTSVFALGQGGVYLGLDDVWVEHVSGHTALELLPDKQAPQIEMVLSGTKGHSAEGFKLRLKAEGFRLAGDKGMGVPKISFDSLKITVAVAVRVSLSFDVRNQKWTCPPKSFRIDIISFKGPYGINRSMVGLVLSLVSPMIRRQLLANLPHELGNLMRTFPSPFTARGEFDVVGTDLALLAAEMHRTGVMAALAGYSEKQVAMFYWLQKAMERSASLKTASDLILYRKALERHPAKWAAIQQLWSQAARIYSDKVIAAKRSRMGQQTLTPREAEALTVCLEPFLKACDDLMKKRLVARYELEFVDGQMSLNHLLNFSHQLLYRFASEAIAKATNGLQKVRLETLIERLAASHAAGKENLKLVSKNIDFAQLTVQARLHAGPSGELKLTVRDILAQAPVLLKLNISKEKNLGALPLVPYIISFKPQENGDIHLEVYHFSHDVDGRSSAEGPKADTCSLARQYQGSPVSTGTFSTSYNRAMSSITASKAAQQQETLTRMRSASSVSQVSHVSRASLHSVSAGRTQSTEVYHEETTALAFSVQQRCDGLPANMSHLLARHEDMRRELQETLQSAPRGDEADSIVTLVARSPHISMIVDKAVTLKPGAELFTMVIGPKEKGWQPFGAVNMFEQSEEQERGFAAQAVVPEEVALLDVGLEGVPVPSAAPDAGCPIMMQTAPGIKMLTQVPKANVSVNLPGLVRFTLAHFADLALLKDYLESLLGGTFYEEQLLVAQKIIDTLAKYLLLPGLDIDVNINGKVVAMGSEIMVRIETPEEVLEHGRSNGGPEEGAAATAADTCAIKFRAELNLQDLFNDSVDIESFVKQKPPAAAAAAVACDPPAGATASPV